MLEAKKVREYTIRCPQITNGGSPDVPPCVVNVTVERRKYQGFPNPKKTFTGLEHIIEGATGVPDCPAMKFLRAQQFAKEVSEEPISELKLEMRSCDL